MSYWESQGGGQVASQALGMLGGIGQANRQYHRQKKLMGFQQQNQMALNQQGHDLQMDMWNKTNYGAQVKHMKDAGLNPALMYGSAGQGGSTGSQGGGSAAGGNAVAERVMDLSNMLTGAQIKDLEASAKKKEVEADKISGADTNKINIEIRNLNEDQKRIIAQAAKHVSEKEKIDIENELLNIDKEFFKKNDLAPSDFGILKGLKRAGFDIMDAVKWLLDIDEKEVDDMLNLPGEIRNNSNWRNKNN